MRSTPTAAATISTRRRPAARSTAAARPRLPGRWPSSASATSRPTRRRRGAGRSDCFGTLQDRLPKELADAGITTLEGANRYLAETYLPAHNRRFRVDPAEPGSAFVPWAGGELAEILCHQEDRVVARDNTVQFGRLTLQIPESPLRPHFVKATVQVRRYTDGALALFHGPRCIGRYQADGTPVDTTKLAA